MRSWLSLLFPIAFTLVGCGQAPETPALESGDVVRPRISFPPSSPWRAGGKGRALMSLEAHHPGSEGPTLLLVRDVPHEGVLMRARVTFFAGVSPLGEPLEVPFTRDC